MIKRFFSALVVLGLSVSAFAIDTTMSTTGPAPTNQAPVVDATAPGQVQWYTNYQEAVAAAKSGNKPIVLFFTGSDWCGWCKKMESEVFSTPEFAKKVGNRFVFVDLDFPMNKTLPSGVAEQNAALKQKYGITGYPTLVVLDSNENFIAETGYRPGGGAAYADYLISLVQ